MEVTKENNQLILTLTPVEEKAVDFLIERRGNKGFMNGLQAWLDTRVATVEDEERREVFAIFKNMTLEEQEEFLERKKNV